MQRYTSIHQLNNSWVSDVFRVSEISHGYFMVIAQGAPYSLYICGQRVPDSPSDYPILTCELRSDSYYVTTFATQEKQKLYFC